VLMRTGLERRDLVVGAIEDVSAARSVGRLGRRGRAFDVCYAPNSGAKEDLARGSSRANGLNRSRGRALQLAARQRG
jgi:hypothetical protein